MEHRLFDPANPPEWLDPEWWRDRPHCDHLGSPTGAHVARLRAAAELAYRAVGMLPLGEKWPHVVDLGAGDGALLSLLPAELRSRSFGYDAIKADVEHACVVRSVEVLGPIDVAWTLARYPASLHLGSVVVLTEVLEHMADPHGFLAKLHARPAVRFVVASSPHSETPEEHEWNHAWAWDEDGYELMFEAAGFEGVQCDRVEWSQLWLFEAVRDGEVEQDAAEMEEERHADRAAEIEEATRSEYVLGLREGITDLDPMVAQLLVEGRKAGLP